MKRIAEVDGLNKKAPLISAAILLIIISGCVFSDLFIPYDPQGINLSEINIAPGKNHIFGTDTLGRDVFSMIWHGGRKSLFIGFFATAVSTVIAVIYGCISGLVREKADDVLMRITDILMSIPQVLMVIFVQAVFGEPDIISISIVIALTGWMNISKMVRTEVRQVRNSDYVLAARTMGGSFFYILWNHLRPNFTSAIMFMSVSNIAGAISMEATLSFLGIGLPTSEVSWGTLMSLSQKAMLSGNWWILVIPGFFLISTIISVTEVGEYLKNRSRNESYL